jgi:hypothetical protein
MMANQHQPTCITLPQENKWSLDDRSSIIPVSVNLLLSVETATPVIVTTTIYVNRNTEIFMNPWYIEKISEIVTVFTKS